MTYIPDLGEFLSATRVTIRRREKAKLAIEWCKEELGESICSLVLIAGDDDGVIFTITGYGSRSMCVFDHKNRWAYVEDIWEGTHFFFKSINDATRFKLIYG